MNFHRGKHREEPEINFIPLIDLLLVIVIFLVVTTTYARFSELQINLPSAKGEQAEQKEKTINVAVNAEGRFLIDNKPVTFSDAAQLAEDLKQASGGAAEPVIVINADASARHQNVIDVMEAARLAGFVKLTFATQAPEGAASH